MVARSPVDRGGRGGLLGLYALAQMARRGPVHGYLISEQIAEKTEGAWRPGPGAVYPALNRLTARGLARSRVVGRRRVYSITPDGRSMLARLRSRTASWTPRALDLSALWAEVAGVDDVGTFLLLRLRRSLDAVDAALAAPRGGGAPSPGMQTLRADVIAELSAHVDALRRKAVPTLAVPARRARGRKP